MRLFLSGLCALTIAVAAWLGVMFIVLGRPGFERDAAISVLIVLQSLLALAVANSWLSGGLWGVLASFGALPLTSAGVLLVIRTLNRPHFEGYLLMIGVLLLLQGLITLVTSIVKSAPIRRLT